MEYIKNQEEPAADAPATPEEAPVEAA